MKLSALFVMVAMFSATARAATITVTITGTTGEIRVGEGPIFGHRSYTLIPPGDPFALTYTFDEEKGKQSLPEVSDGLITQSGIENTELSSPGTSATLQIGSALWEFGFSARSQMILKTSASSKSEQFVFIAAGGRQSSLRSDCSRAKAAIGRRTAIGGRALPLVRLTAAPVLLRRITTGSPRREA